MRKRVLYPPPLTRSPSFHMEGGFRAPLALVGWCIFGRKCVGYSYEIASPLSSTAHAVPLLPHGRRLEVVQPRSVLLMKEGSG